MIRKLLPMLYRAAEIFKFDIALVTNEHHMYSALQAERKLGQQAQWSVLSEALVQQAKKLADAAMRDRLVLFIGAGASVSCGLPSWWGLLRQLADSAPSPLTEQELNELLALSNPLEQGQRLLGYYESEAAFKQRAAQLCTPSSFGLQQALLGALPIREAITTNYDDCFERSIRGGGRRLVTIPYSSPEGADVWLLKMHGCINHPGDIVLTQNDYDMYADRRAALAGIVQASLITKHLLFVGFGLRDPNFIQIISTVRKSIEHHSSSQRHLGTSIQLSHLQDLSSEFSRDLSFAWMNKKSPAKAARLSEIFLDLVAAEASNPTRFLNSPMYTSLLSPQEKILQDKIRALLCDVPEEVKATGAFEVLHRALVQSFGEYDRNTIQREFIEKRFSPIQEKK